MSEPKFTKSLDFNYFLSYYKHKDKKSKKGFIYG